MLDKPGSSDYSIPSRTRRIVESIPVPVTVAICLFDVGSKAASTDVTVVVG